MKAKKILPVHDQFFISSWSYLGHMKNFLRTVTDSSSVHEFFMNTSWGQFISKSSWTKTMNYSSPVHEHFMNGLKGSWFHELHFAGVWLPVDVYYIMLIFCCFSSHIQLHILGYRNWQKRFNITPFLSIYLLTSVH